jgi:hypothetical protein
MNVLACFAFILVVNIISDAAFAEDVTVVKALNVNPIADVAVVKVSPPQDGYPDMLMFEESCDYAPGPGRRTILRVSGGRLKTWEAEYYDTTGGYPAKRGGEMVTFRDASLAKELLVNVRALLKKTSVDSANRSEENQIFRPVVCGLDYAGDDKFRIFVRRNDNIYWEIAGIPAKHLLALGSPFYYSVTVPESIPRRAGQCHREGSQSASAVFQCLFQYTYYLDLRRQCAGRRRDGFDHSAMYDRQENDKEYICHWLGYSQMQREKP